MQRDYYYSVARSIDDLDDPGECGLKRRGAPWRDSVRNRSRPGVIRYCSRPKSPAALIGHLIGALSGGSLYRKASFLTDSLGRKLLPEPFSVVERPVAAPWSRQRGIRRGRRGHVREGVHRSGPDRFVRARQLLGAASAA